jgi:hypothetical protein
MQRSYMPGKPAPNMLEYVVDVDEFGWVSCLCWTKTWGWDDKYSLPSEKLTQMEVFINHLRQWGGAQPFVLYIDARWASLELYRKLVYLGFQCVLSIGGNAGPKKLFGPLRSNLEKGEWTVLYHRDTGGQLVTLRAKKKAYLQILSNYVGGQPVPSTRTRRKPPMATYDVMAPACQDDYNKFKSCVDIFNKMVRAYHRPAKFTKLSVAYTQFFIHSFVLQAFCIYRTVTSSGISQRDFRLILLKSLAAPSLPPSLPQGVINLPFHWPQEIEGDRKRCQQQGCDNKTIMFCSQCNLFLCKAHMKACHIK